MRTRMPKCAAFVDALRAAFGVQEIDDVIRRGLRPDCNPAHRVFFSESGVTLGTRPLDPVNAVSATDMVIGPPPAIEKKRGQR